MCTQWRMESLSVPQLHLRSSQELLSSLHIRCKVFVILGGGQHNCVFGWERRSFLTSHISQPVWYLTKPMGEFFPVNDRDAKYIHMLSRSHPSEWWRRVQGYSQLHLQTDACIQHIQEVDFSLTCPPPQQDVQILFADVVPRTPTTPKHCTPTVSANSSPRPESV